MSQRMSRPALSWDLVDYPEPHKARTRALLEAHPEARALLGKDRSTAVWVVAIVGLQIAIAWALRSQPWWVLLPAAYLVGALADHALWTLIHDCTHDLVFRKSRWNKWLQILANLPIVFPAAISFRKFHLLHHAYQGHPELDADLASPLEARLVGNRTWRKALWLLTFFAWQSLRVPRLKRVQMFDRWYLSNLGVQLVFLGALWALGGWRPVLYLTLSSIFAIGLHPVGARWIQEHYLTSGTTGQETFSYYGPLNLLAFNVGYHNEHHDLMTVPWSRLPRLKAMAPEFYNGLVAHRSWTALLFRFLLDPSLSLYSRRIRKGAAAVTAERPADTAFTDGIISRAIEEARAA
jgi:sphingolipid 4-desaturase/C4-monooxygenase